MRARRLNFHVKYHDLEQIARDETIVLALRLPAAKPNSLSVKATINSSGKMPETQSVGSRRVRPVRIVVVHSSEQVAR